MNSTTRRFLGIDMIFEGGRMFVGAIGAAYLISRGVSLSQIATLKMIQATVILVCEVPTGVLGDALGRKFSLLTSILCGALGFLGFYFGETFPHFILAETLTALSLCFWSGSFEAWAIESSKLENKPIEIQRFFQWNLGLNQAAVLIFGFGGAWIGQRDLSTAYLAALTSFLVLGGILAITPERHSRPDRRPGFSEIRFYIRSAGNLLIKNREIRLPVLILTLLQFFVQPILHYWQPFFMRWEGVGASTLGYIFAAYCGGVSIASYFLARIGSSPAPSATTVFTLLVWGGMIASPSLGFSVLFFCGLQIGIAALRSRASARIATLAPSDSRASVMSGVSWISRLGMLSSLGLLSLILPKQDPQKLIPEILTAYLALGVTLGVALVVYHSRRRNHATHPTR